SRQCFELALPEHAVSLDPVRGVAERSRVELTAADSAESRAPHEAGAFENPEMLGDRRPRHAERFGELADRVVAAREARGARAWGGVGEGREGAVRPCAFGTHVFTSVGRPFCLSGVFFLAPGASPRRW